MGRRRSWAAGAALFSAGALAAGGTASGSAPPTPWGGTNPFRCTLQNAGFGTQVPHPEADPYCVEFDKRRQNVAQLGVVEFLSKEPARVSAASPKCFYFQSDHWRGSVVQQDNTTKTYEWDGHYFFDKARGEGGVWVTNFSFNGQTSDPSTLPGLPAQYAHDFGPGTGGMITHDQVQADPTCAARAAKEGSRIYAPPPGARTPCASPRGGVNPGRLGPVVLREREHWVRHRLGNPRRVNRGFLHFCLRGGGSLRVGEREDRSGELGEGSNERSVMLVGTSSALSFDGVHPRARAVWRGARVVLRYGPFVVYVHRGVLAGVLRHRVRYLAVFDRRVVVGARALRAFLVRAG
ncbi:MAG: hypothetical protein QOK31_652 [Solirubrobacteraceae bacterium]|jgi:hypothetical protein|nr:hypothetical protein [Solirubrobacteraceae bacterium]